MMVCEAGDGEMLLVEEFGCEQLLGVIREGKGFLLSEVEFGCEALERKAIMMTVSPNKRS